MGDLNRVPTNKEFTSGIDNSEFQPERKLRDVTIAYNDADLMKAEKEYYETLMTRSKLLEAENIKMMVKGKIASVPVTEVVHPLTEFEEVRLAYSRAINAALHSGDPKAIAEVRTSMLRYQTESPFILAERKANQFLADKRKKEESAKLSKYL